MVYVQAASVLAGPLPLAPPPGSLTWGALFASLPVGGLTTGILVLDNIRDLPFDRDKGEITLAVLMGPRWSRAEHATLLGLAYVVPVALWTWGAGSGPPCSSPSPTRPSSRRVWRGEPDEARRGGPAGGRRGDRDRPPGGAGDAGVGEDRGVPLSAGVGGGTLKLFAARKDEQNKAAIDPWTVVHFAAGLALGLTNVPFRPAMGASIGYEVVEQAVERQRWGERLFDVSGPESLPNVALDLAAFALGHRAGAWWNRSDEGERAG